MGDLEGLGYLKQGRQWVVMEKLGLLALIVLACGVGLELEQGVGGE